MREVDIYDQTNAQSNRFEPANQELPHPTLARWYTVKRVFEAHL